MPSIKSKTYHAKPGDVERRWFVVDAEGQTVGRLASRVAHVLRGKHKPQFTPSLDTGDFVVIINAEKAVFTGNKLESKIYYRTTTRPGSLRAVDAKTQLANKPERVLEDAVWGMLPHTTLGRAQHRKLHVYAGTKHPHTAQNPQTLDIVTLASGDTSASIAPAAEKPAKKEKPKKAEAEAVVPTAEAAKPEAEPSEGEAPKAEAAEGEKTEEAAETAA